MFVNGHSSSSTYHRKLGHMFFGTQCIPFYQIYAGVSSYSESRTVMQHGLTWDVARTVNE